MKNKIVKPIEPKLECMTLDKWEALQEELKMWSYDLELKDMKLELHFSKHYEIEDTVYYKAIAVLEDTIYVLVKANLIKINISELKEDIDFMQLVEDKYYKRG